MYFQRKVRNKLIYETLSNIAHLISCFKKYWPQKLRDSADASSLIELSRFYQIKSLKKYMVSNSNFMFNVS